MSLEAYSGHGRGRRVQRRVRWLVGIPIGGEQKGPQLGYPYSSDVRGAKHGNLRELRVQHAGRPYRVLYAFDPRRSAILPLGGDRTGNARWYEDHVPIADRLYEEQLAELRREGAI